MSIEILTVAALNSRAREILQQHFPLLWVGGEVSNLTRAASGHFYFSLKDATAQVRCVMFRNRAQVLAWRLENGQQVEAQALVTLYEARGEFQLNIEGLRRAGVGALYEAYARLRLQLETEGLFAADKKLPLPGFPRSVGIVTSPQAAALRDVISTLARRAPHLRTVLYPVPVQGDGAAQKIAAAIALAGERTHQDGIDVLLVVRGGGSIEDLWAFNEECVVRAVAACRLPVVTGIGHETDFCIVDFAADQRAATPTAAAELVSAGWFAAADQLAALGVALQRALRRSLEARMQHLDLMAQRLVHPGKRLKHQRETAAHLATRLKSALASRLRQEAVVLENQRWRLGRARPATQTAAAHVALAEQRLGSAVKCHLAALQARLGTLSAALAPLSPQATLERGYSIVRDSHGALVFTSHQLASGDTIELHFAKGWAHAHVDTSE
ncbi:MAG: exodeoxyribonuclease VII large subunit [Betaproteobacteria bacterium]|nr:exodeoxyribonuclease VII large subunit [Betaproteobacteria bacterium]